VGGGSGDRHFDKIFWRDSLPIVIIVIAASA